MTFPFRYFKTLALTLLLPLVAMLFVLWDQINLQYLFVFVLLASVVALAWDIWSTRQGSRDTLWVWRYNPKTTTGVRVLGHPLEQYVFAFGTILWIVLFWELVISVTNEYTEFQAAILLAIVLWEFFAVAVIYRRQVKESSDAASSQR